MSYFLKYSLIVFISAIGVTGQLLLRKGLETYSNVEVTSFFSKLFSIILQPVVLVALFCYGFGLIAYLFLLSKLEITAIYPITTSLTFGGITLFGYFLLGESLNAAKVIGIVLIVVGIIMIDRLG